jgi:predicted transcriptional regulator
VLKRRLTRIPFADPAFDETRQEAIQTLRSIAKQGRLVSGERTDHAAFEKCAGMLLKLGLVRGIATPEGTSYEITESGSRFLEEYPHVEQDTSLGLKIDTDQVARRLVKEKVTVVIPTLNEAEAIGEVIREVKTEGYERILVLDGYSTDRTPHIADASGAKVVYQHGSGKAGAVKTAIERVETPYILFMDGDCTYDPKDIWRLLNHNERYSHVIGARDRRHIPRLHRLGNWAISEVFSLLFAVRATDVCSGMYLLETEEARNYRLEDAGFIAEIELAAQSASTESLAEVPISYRPRVGRRKLSTWRHGLAILSAAFRLARRYNPILLYSGLAGFSIIPAALVLGWVAFELLTRDVWHLGWALVGIMLLLVAAQAFTLASVSILTKHTEKRLIQAMKRSTRSS